MNLVATSARRLSALNAISIWKATSRTGERSRVNWGYAAKRRRCAHEARESARSKHVDMPRRCAPIPVAMPSQTRVNPPNKRMADMRKSKRTEEPFIGVLNRATAGSAVNDLCWQEGFGEATCRSAPGHPRAPARLGSSASPTGVPSSRAPVGKAAPAQRVPRLPTLGAQP